MSEIILVRQSPAPITEAERDAAVRFIFGMIDGLGERGRKQWRGFWNRLLKLEPGEMMKLKTHLQRSGPFHRRHFAIEQALFDAQERFDDFDQYLYWLKVGAKWVTWAPGPSGGVVPIPKSISYAVADELEFRRFHSQAMAFLHGPHAAKYLWPHLKDKAPEMMRSILDGFQE